MTDTRNGRSSELAGIQYHGLAGISQACKEAVINLIQVGERISAAKLVSAKGEHGLILTVGVGDIIAVKSGFASGYAGEGPSALSYTLALLRSHGVEISEHEVDPAFIERLDNSALTILDLEWLDGPRRAHGRWSDHVQELHWQRADDGGLWEEFPAIVPFAIIDPRILDLARSFWEDPDARLLTAYRRLEDIVRGRVGSDEHGARLFSQAFSPSTGKLGWGELSDTERGARSQLFSSAYTAFRNARAHRERREKGDQQLAEFLLVNQLYRLESAAVASPEPRPIKPEHSAGSRAAPNNAL